MKTTIDRAGRVVIPKALRDRLGLRGGEEIEVQEAEGRIEITRSPRSGGLVKGAHGILVFESDSNEPPVDPEFVREAIEASRAYPRDSAR